MTLILTVLMLYVFTLSFIHNMKCSIKTIKTSKVHKLNEATSEPTPTAAHTMKTVIENTGSLTAEKPLNTYLYVNISR